MSETWTEVTAPSETWTVQSPDDVGDGFSQGFAARPAFAVASRAGIWTEQTEQSEVWAVA